MKRPLRLGLPLLAMTLAACDAGEPTAGTHVGNPGALRFAATSAVAVGDAPASRDGDGAVHAFTEARVNLRDIELDLPDGVECADIADQLVGAYCDAADAKVVVEGPRVVDLLAGTATPSLDDVRLPPLVWRRIDFRLDDARDLPGDDLEGYSFVARAIDPGGERADALHIRLAMGEDARVEAPEGVMLPEGGLLVVDFDVEAWLADLPLAQCVEDGELRVEGGAVIIDERSGCGDLERRLKDNIKDNTRLRAEGG